MNRLPYQLDKRELRVIGLMSGTSMDGLDICDAEITLHEDEFSFKINAYRTYPYSEDFRQSIKKAFTSGAESLCRLNFELGRRFADSLEDYMTSHHLTSSDIDLIGSHGHTIWHIHGDSTLQLGEAAVVAEKTGIPVVADFRVRDVAAGGSGAPLVPFLDYLLFRNRPEGRLILNIGGIANFTLVPSYSSSVNSIYALDTGPGVCLINEVASRMTAGSLSFDKDAELAKKGVIRDDILDFLLNHPYLKLPPPKSTGREIFSPAMVDEIVRKFTLKENELSDLMATLTRFTAEAICFHYRKYFESSYPINELIMSGGGTENPLIVKHLEELFRPVPLKRIEEYGIPSDAKEAFAFAVLAVAYIRGMSSNIPGATGAKHQVVLGKLSLP